MQLNKFGLKILMVTSLTLHFLFRIEFQNTISNMKKSIKSEDF